MKHYVNNAETAALEASELQTENVRSNFEHLAKEQLLCINGGTADPILAAILDNIKPVTR